MWFYAPIPGIPNMLNRWQSVIMATTQEPGPFQLPGITYRSLQQGLCILILQHEVMVGNKWHNGLHQALSLHSKCHQYTLPICVVQNIWPAHTIAPLFTLEKVWDLWVPLIKSGSKNQIVVFVFQFSLFVLIMFPFVAILTFVLQKRETNIFGHS